MSTVLATFRYCNQTCTSMNLLPNETLGDIFTTCIPSITQENVEHVVHSDATNPNRIRTNLMLVCRLWRMVIEHTPTAWRTLAIPSTRAFDAARVEKWFTLAGACGTDVALFRPQSRFGDNAATSLRSSFAQRHPTENGCDTSRIQVVQGIMGLIIKYAGNINGLYLPTDGLDFNTIMRPFSSQEISMPKLTWFIADFARRTDQVTNKVSIKAPMLKHLYLGPFATSFLDIITPASLQALAHVDMSIVPPHSLATCCYLAYVAQEGFSLTSLNLTCEGSLEEQGGHIQALAPLPPVVSNLSENPTLTFPGLRELALTVSPGGETQLFAMLSCNFSAPALTKCRITGTRMSFSLIAPLLQGGLQELTLVGFRVNDVGQVFERVGKTLRILCLEECEIGKDAKVLSAVGQACGKLESLAMTASTMFVEDLEDFFTTKFAANKHKPSYTLSILSDTTKAVSVPSITLRDAIIVGELEEYMRVTALLRDHLIFAGENLLRLYNFSRGVHKRYTEQGGRNQVTLFHLCPEFRICECLSGYIS